jgi:hypothetical protein
MSSASATTEPPVIPATGAYEDWLRERTDVIEVDLQYKHQQMKASLFAFLPGTFYRWAALAGGVPGPCQGAAGAGGGRSSC